MVTCTKCGLEKEQHLFPKDKQKKTGYKSACKECYKKYDLKRYWSNPEQQRKRVQDYRNSLSPEQRYLSNRNTKLKQAYGISSDDFEKLKEEQNHCCYVCKTHENKVGSKRLVVDHHHTTGSVRKLLCSNCNTALGLVNENTEILQCLIKYIEEHN